MGEHEIGVVGLATMGENLARNLASHGARVAVYNRTHKRTEDFMSAHSRDGDFRPAASLEELARILQPPRAIVLMVKAGSAVDDAIALFSGVKVDQARTIWLVDKAPVVIEKLKDAKTALENFMQSQGLTGKPEDVANLKGDDARVAFVKHFKEVQKLQTQLDQYRPEP